MLLVVLVFNVLIAGGLGYQVVMGQKAAKEAAKAGGGEHHGEHEEKAEKFGPLIEVGSLVANLGGPASGHYVKVALHIETTNEETAKKLEAALVPIRSEALQYLSGIDVKEASDKDRIKNMSEELRQRLVKLVGKELCKRVYFSEFVVQ